MGVYFRRGPMLFRLTANVRDRLRLQQIIRAGHEFDETGSLDPCDFVRLLEGSRFSKSEPAAIRVMTIHQSKGLEFDIVVLPELDERLLQTPSAAVGYSEAGGQADRVVVWRSKEARALLPKPLQLAFEEDHSSAGLRNPVHPVCRHDTRGPLAAYADSTNCQTHKDVFRTDPRSPLRSTGS